MHKKTKTLMWLAVAIIVVSYAGIPGTWKTFLNVVLALSIMGVAYSLRKIISTREDEKYRPVDKPYTENEVSSKVNIKSENSDSSV